MKLVSLWKEYWFQPVPLFHLAVCRVIVVAVQLFRIFHVTYHQVPVKANAADHLYDPLPILHLMIAPFGWHYRPDLLVLNLVLGLTITAGFTSLFGLGTNVSLLIFALGNIFLQSFMYSFGDLHHPETLMMIALIALALSPCGRFSQEKSIYALWPFRLMQWMFAWMYFSAALEKLEEAGLQWMNGFTMQYYWASAALHYDIPIGFWLSQQHQLSILISWLSILFEGTFFLAILFPQLLWLYVPVGFAFHLGIAVTMKAYFYQYMALYCFFAVPMVSEIRAYILTAKKSGGGGNCTLVQETYPKRRLHA